MAGLHREVRSHVAWLPGAQEFLSRLRAKGKRLVLLTNSHPTALAVKHEQTGCVCGMPRLSIIRRPKDQAQLWQAARARFGYDPARSLFADDNSRMLEAARDAGVRWVYGVRHWDTKGSRREHLAHPAVDGVIDLL